MAKTPDASAAEKKRLADEKKKLKEEQKKQKKEAKNGQRKSKPRRQSFRRMTKAAVSLR